jgi:uncharacterized membrane protein
MDPKKFLTTDQQQEIIAAIKEAEKNTSGEIRVHLESLCKIEPTERAVQVFKKLGMHKTELKNGVLFYLATQSKKIAVIGDKGINDKVESNFWMSIKETVLNDFSKNNYTEGLKKGILETGLKLSMHFPYQKNDINELSDDISFGENN